VYQFLPGRVCTPADLGRAPVWRGVARRLGEWHAVLSITRMVAAPADSSSINGGSNGSIGHGAALQGVSNGHARLEEETASMLAVDGTRSSALHHAPAKAGPSLWATLQKWVDILPEKSTEQARLKALLRCEAQRVAKEMSHVSSLGSQGVRPSPPNFVSVFYLSCLLKCS
jgi:ethanolamine kinase